MLPQQMAEPAHRGLVRHRFPPRIDAHKLPIARRIVQRFFHPGSDRLNHCRKKNIQHPLRSHRRPPLARFGIHRLGKRTQLRPRRHLLHLFQKTKPAASSCVALKAARHRQHLLSHLHICPPDLDPLYPQEGLFRVSLGQLTHRYATGKLTACEHFVKRRRPFYRPLIGLQTHPIKRQGGASTLVRGLIPTA